MNNITLIERIECAHAMAKAMLANGKVVKAHKFLARAGF